MCHRRKLCNYEILYVKGSFQQVGKKDILLPDQVLLLSFCSANWRTLVLFVLYSATARMNTYLYSMYQQLSKAF